MLLMFIIKFFERTHKKINASENRDCLGFPLGKPKMYKNYLFYHFISQEHKMTHPDLGKKLIC